MYEIIDNVERVRHTVKTKVEFARLVRDLTLRYGDIEIEENEDIIIINI